MTLNYQDPLLSTVPLKSRTLSGEHIVAHDISALPGTVETDIAANRGFLATLAGAVLVDTIRVVMQSSTAVIGKLAANAGVNIGTVDVASGSVALSAALPSGANAIGKLAANAGVNIGEVSTAAPSAATVTAVPASVTVVTLLAANAARVGAIISNTSTTGTLYVKFSTGATTSSWSVPIAPGGTYEMPRRYYTGIITGIWTVANGDAKVTETA